MFKHVLEISAAAALSAAICAPGSASEVAYSTSPIAVTSCSVSDSFAPWQPSNEGAQIPAPSSVAISFVNKSNLRATNVTFELVDGRSKQTFVDKGSFSPGVRIEHIFAADTRTSMHEDGRCNVVNVDFLDGNTWRSDAVDTAQR